ncbi:hypothetical protein H1R20_g11987, partial [Candolleomyces eurysporus]
MTRTWHSLGGAVTAALATVSCFGHASAVWVPQYLNPRSAGGQYSASTAAVSSTAWNSPSATSTENTTTPASPTSTSTTGSSTTNSTLDGKYVASAWYPSWLASTYPPESLPWDKYNMMTFSFATTTSGSTLLNLDSDSQALLPTFVQLAKKNNVKALVSIGGWGGSQYFSTDMATGESRSAFVKAVVDLATKYDLDGIDFDWEFPGKQSIGCNVVSPSDTASYLLFLQELRKDPVGAKLILTAAVGLTPWVGQDGTTPVTDVSGFGKVFDFIAIMAYDVWGSWSTSVGPNAPLYDACAPTKDGSAESAVAAWSGAGFPVNKIVLGLPAYARSYHVESGNALSGGKLGLYPPFDKAQQPLGEGEKQGQLTADQCGTESGPSGIFNFNGLVTAGFLNVKGTVASGVDYKFDDCSKTAFAYDQSKSVMVSYDDAATFAAKGQFIVEKGLKGFSMWHAVGDSNNILLDAVNSALSH